MKSLPRAKPAPPVLISWALGHPRHLKTASWLSSVHGAAAITKPESEAIKKLLRDLRLYGPADLHEFAVSAVGSLPPSFSTRREREEFRSAGVLSSPPRVGQLEEMAGATTLLQWCGERREHVLPALWLLSVYGVSILSRPTTEAIETLLIDLHTHAPRDLYDLGASMAKEIPSAFVTPAERDSYLRAIEWLQLTEEARS